MASGASDPPDRSVRPPLAASGGRSGYEGDVFRPGDRRCTWEGCKEDAAILCSDDGWVALCSTHAGEYEVERARFKEAPTRERWQAFDRVWVAAQGGAQRAAERMRGYAARKRLAGRA